MGLIARRTAGFIDTVTENRASWRRAAEITVPVCALRTAEALGAGPREGGSERARHAQVLLRADSAFDAAGRAGLSAAQSGGRDDPGVESVQIVATNGESPRSSIG